MERRHLRVVSGALSEPGEVHRSCHESQSVSCRASECWRLFRWFLRGGASFHTFWRRCALRSRPVSAIIVPPRENVAAESGKKSAVAE
jgi:hypothetical protein